MYPFICLYVKYPQEFTYNWSVFVKEHLISLHWILSKAGSSTAFPKMIDGAVFQVNAYYLGVKIL